MDILYSFHDNMVKQVASKFYRFLYDQINWDQQLLAIKGPRGSGKTTLMLQRIKFDLKDSPMKTLYISADHYWFYNHTLAETAEDFVKNGGKNLFIDEVHKYPYWSREIKNIFDAYPDLRLVLSASSALEFFQGEADLSRRLISYNLPGLSFREFLIFNGHIHLPSLPFHDIIQKHESMSREITSVIHPIPLFNEYLKYGYLPFYKSGNEKDYQIKIFQIINTVLENDLLAIEGFNAGTARKLKNLLGIVAASVPFKPNISSLARKLDASRDSVYGWLTSLEKAKLINLLIDQGKSTSSLQKPEKVFLENSNLAYALKNSPEVGNLRETFLLNQLNNSGLQVFAPNMGDFKVDDYLIEVGGKNKMVSEKLNNLIIAADNIENGYGKKIPLWLFGLLY